MPQCIIEALADENFVGILNCYWVLKIHRKIHILLSSLIIMIPFSYSFWFVALIITIAICLATMSYLVIEQGRIISNMQQSLYSICLKSIAQVSEDREAEERDWSFQLLIIICQNLVFFLTSSRVIVIYWIILLHSRGTVPLHSFSVIWTDLHLSVI